MTTRPTAPVVAERSSSRWALLSILTAAYGAKPANFHTQQFRDYKDGQLYWVVVNGKNAMPGHAADLCLFDPEQYWKVEAASLNSQGKNTPFLGVELPGKVRYTLVGGHLVYES